MRRKKKNWYETFITDYPKNEQSHDFEGMLKMIQKLSNRVIYLEKEKES